LILVFCLSAVSALEHTCTDSDNGKDYYEKGSTQLFENGEIILSYGDECVEPQEMKLREYYCDENGYPIYENIECPSICRDGACVEDERIEKKCFDSDGGKNLSVLGIIKSYNSRGTWDTFSDYCTYSENGEQELMEYFCEEGNYSQISTKCSEECHDGVCTAPIKTEKITCKFENSDDVESCFTYFQNGYVNASQYYCEGVGECDTSLTGEEGSQLKWTAGSEFCLETHTMVVNGDNKVIEFDCKKPNILKRTFKYLASGYDIISEFGLETFYSNRIGFRDFYYLCSDGTEESQKNEAPVCKFASEWENYAEELCKYKCVRHANGLNPCGVKIATSSEMCLMDGSEKDFEGELNDKV
ncbi:MAG: hypothetical protein OQK82_03565, partial [Candidatus Pacearchaeota archaeon]|nr:hypothetical protein [Candidatus Pacearchaeota archaeon]